MQLLTGPSIEPITLAEAKAFLRVEHNDDDAMIKALIAGARAQIEWHTRRIMNTQTWRPVRDAWPASGQINLPSLPLRSLIAVRIHNGEGDRHGAPSARTIRIRRRTSTRSRSKPLSRASTT